MAEESNTLGMHAMTTETRTLYVGGRISAIYKPLPDITAYELAVLLPIFLIPSDLTEKSWASLGTATRHLERV